MKYIYSILAGLLLTVSVFAQAPQKMSYQAVIRNSSSTLITSTPVGMRISILQGSATGTAVYVEIYNPNPVTNANGLVSLEIGTGLPVTGTFAGINWATGPYFIKTETDPTGGTAYTIAGTNELMSVPYALFSANVTPGPIGATGATGAAGTNGTNGLVGATGAAGINGTNGLVGATGAAGTNGTNGLVGATGAAGTNGTNGLVGATGAAGTNGTNGLVGATGATGPTGLTGATGANAGVGGFTHYLGEAFNGGIIYYLYKGSDGFEHGLIVALTESATTMYWQAPYSFVNANRTEDGAYNTALMTNSPAATYIATLTGTGWYLPSIGELALLDDNMYSAQKGLRAGNHTLISMTTHYWSSTEESLGEAYAREFANDDDGPYVKGNNWKARGVKAF